MLGRHEITENVYDEFGGGGGGGDDSPRKHPFAIEVIRTELGKAFLEKDQTLLDLLLLERDALKTKFPQWDNEDEIAYHSRLEKQVLLNNKDVTSYLESKVRLVGFILGHPSNDVVQKEILPKLDYWHYRTGKHVDIVCLGFSRNSKTTFDGEAFNMVVDIFQERFKWEYSWQTDLLLTNIRYNVFSGGAWFDLRDVVALVLEDAIADKAIRSVSALIEDIVNTLEEYNGDNPSWVISDRQGLRFAGSGIKQFILSLLPEWAREDAKKAFHFHVRDLT